MKVKVQLEKILVLEVTTNIGPKEIKFFEAQVKVEVEVVAGVKAKIDKKKI